MKMGFENEIGAQAPLGFWDPLGLLEGQDQEFFDKLRYQEIKHGRIAMIAVLGHITQQNVRCVQSIRGKTSIHFVSA